MTMQRTSIGLRATITITITLVMTATILLISFVVLTIAKKNLLDQKVHMGKSIITSLQEGITSLSPPTHDTHFPFDPESLRVIIDRYARNFSLKNLVIFDRTFTCRITIPHGAGPYRRNHPALQEAFSSGTMITEFGSYQGKEHLFITAPLPQNGTPEAVLQAVFPLSDVEDLMSTFQQVIVLFTLTTTFMFIIIGSFLLTRYLVKPLEKLIKTTEDIGEGYFPQSLEPTNRNEIGTLAASLFKMAAKLKDDRNQIKQYIQSLEETNAQLKKTQEEVLRSEKLASVGKLAAGIAHEIGNPIGIVLGYLELLRRQPNQHEEVTDMLGRIEHELVRVDTTIRELLSFAHPRTAALHAVQVNPLIQEILSLIIHQKECASVTIVTDLQENLPPVIASEQHFQQVLINLIMNALDAMPHGGTLTITSRYDSDTGAPSPAHSPVVTITVRDTGIGIASEALTKIFDPFYTTKPPGKGTGLGLSVCLQIIESFGGTITAESTPGVGTLMTITLPVHSSPNPQCV